MTRTQYPIGDTIVVVPCYNEARRIDLCAFEAYLDQREAVSLLLVDDGSTDDTPRLLEQLRERHPDRVAVYRCERNVGKAEAVRRGVLVALDRQPALVGYWDADLATPLEDVAKFRQLLMRRRELSLVMGSRVALMGRQIKRKWRRHVLGRAFATAASWTLGLVVYDTQCGAKLFRATPQLAAMFAQPFASRWIFDVELLARIVVAARDGHSQPADEVVYELPLDRWVDVPGSRLRPRDFLIAAVDLAAIYWRYTRRGGRYSLPPVAPTLSDTERDTATPRRDAA